MSKKIHLVVQEGGTRSEIYLQAHDTLKDVRDSLKGCEEAAYRTVGPITLPAELTKTLLANEKAKQEFCETVEEILQRTAAHFN